MWLVDQKIAIIIQIGNPRWQPSWKSIFCFFCCTEMPVDSKVGRRHWGWLVLLVTFWKFQHFNLVSKIFQKLFKPLPCLKSIGKMLHAICISAVAVSLRWASCGPWASCLKNSWSSLTELDLKFDVIAGLLLFCCSCSIVASKYTTEIKTCIHLFIRVGIYSINTLIDY